MKFKFVKLIIWQKAMDLGEGEMEYIKFQHLHFN